MTTRVKMTSKLLVFFTTCVLVLVNASNIEKRENAESYITKEAAKELRNKLSHIKSDGNVEEQQDDYDEILKEIIHTIQSQGPKEQQLHNPHTIFYEKKYFDYLPNEISDSDDVTNEDLSHELVKKHSEYNSFEDEQHMVNNDAINTENGESEKHSSGRKIVKRDVMQQDDENKARNKRQSLYFVPLSHYNPTPRVHYFFPSHDPFLSDIFNSIAAETRQSYYAAAAPQAQPQQQFGHNPWTPQNNPNLRLHAPYNYYLPAAHMPSPTYLPAAPTNRPPVNVPSPPDNSDNSGSFDDRVGGFELPDVRPVWSVNQLTNTEGNRAVGTLFSTYSEKLPVQHQSRPYNSPNDIDYDGIFAPNQKQPELEIEYAPELVESATSTTRKPLKLNRKKNQKGNSPSRIEAYQTTTQRPSATFQSTDNKSSSYSQQVNSRKPIKPLPACVEAIVNCCSKYDEVVRVPCFETHNCNGAFFGRSPCSRDIKQAAFREVEKYTK